MLYSSSREPARTRRHAQRMWHEKRLSWNQPWRTSIVSPCSMEQKVHGAKTRIHTAATMGLILSLPLERKRPYRYEIKTSDILRAVAAIKNLPSPTLPDNPFIRALGTSAAHKGLTANWHPSSKSPRGMGTHLVRKQGRQSLRRCKPADQPWSRKMVAKCSSPLSSISH